MLKEKRKKVMTLVIQDMRGHPKQGCKKFVKSVNIWVNEQKRSSKSFWDECTNIFFRSQQKISGAS